MIEYTIKKCESFAFAKNIKQAMNLYKSELSDKNYKKLFIADSTTEIPSIFESVEVANLIDRIKNDKLENVLLFVELGKKKKLIKRIIKENLIFAMSVKVVILLLSVFGYANMWLAVFADTGVTLLTILNTLRIMNKFKEEN